MTGALVSAKGVHKATSSLGKAVLHILGSSGQNVTIGVGAPTDLPLPLRVKL